MPSSALVAALVSTGFISLAPNLLLFAFPGFAEEGAIEGSLLLSMGSALAAGGLLGDVFLHTMAEASDDDDAGLWLLVGFTVFLIMDMCIRSMESSDHDHSHGATPKITNKATAKKDARSTLALMFSSSILLNLTADALHNFTDGLAIGASFASTTGAGGESWQSMLTSRGGLATLSILFHEIPHELGDYCILLKNGFTKKQAIGAQFGTAIAAFLGTFVGLWAASTWSGVVYMTAGGFVYLAGVTILPTVLAESKGSLTFRLAQVLAFLIGIGFLYSVSLLEGDDHHHHGHSHGRSLHHDHHHDHGHHDHHAGDDHLHEL